MLITYIGKVDCVGKRSNHTFSKLSECHELDQNSNPALRFLNRNCCYPLLHSVTYSSTYIYFNSFFFIRRGTTCTLVKIVFLRQDSLTEPNALRIFPFPKPVAIAIESNMTCYLPTAEGRRKGFIPFPINLAKILNK